MSRLELTEEMKAALEQVTLLRGECPLENLNDMNVPVNVFLMPKEDYHDDGLAWRLSYAIFCPRKLVGFEAAVYTADNPEPLRELVRLFIKPFYERALRKINGLVDGSESSLYYW